MARTNWFTHAKLGMIVHWGIYSALERGEWVLNRERIPLKEYRAAAAQFTAARFNADEWADLAVAAGQKYLILTAKHHDGFCLWDTRTTDFKSPKVGPNRDIVAELITAFHRRGLKIGFFFSLADWSHPAYPTPYATDWPQTWRNDQDRATVVAYAMAQIQELTHNYGPIDLMWFDGAAPGMDAASWRAQEIIDLCRASNPDILVNNRLFLPGDFDALELHLHRPETQRPWETDYPMNDSWAWNPSDTNYKPLHVIWQRLLQANGQGGNLLLNVGPRGDGSIPQHEIELLHSLGARIRRVNYHAEELGYGPEAGHLRWLQGAMHTYKGNSLYLHLWYRNTDEVAYGSIKNKVLRATMCDDGRELPFTQDATGRVRIRTLSRTPRDHVGWCIRLDLDGPPEGFGVGHQDLNF
ncbi:MAG: alpha-L-fucosidase [Phycisphaerae bacterium]